MELSSNSFFLCPWSVEHLCLSLSLKMRLQWLWCCWHVSAAAKLEIRFWQTKKTSIYLQNKKHGNLPPLVLSLLLKMTLSLSCDQYRCPLRASNKAKNGVLCFSAGYPEGWINTEKLCCVNTRHPWEFKWLTLVVKEVTWSLEDHWDQRC